MKLYFQRFPIACSYLILAVSLLTPLSAPATAVSLATSPLATSTTTTVKPNVLLVLDNSGSMDWDHMPDDSGDGGSAVTFRYGYYGLRSSQCNQVYYDPSTTYLAPIKADGTSYPDASFTGAWDDGFNTGAGTTNLNTSFQASASLNPDTLGQSAYYYTYSGAQTTQLQKNYNSTTNAFYLECKDSTGSSTSAIAPVNGVQALVGGTPTTVGSGVFTKRKIATTEKATITVGASGSNTTVSSIKVNGVELMSGSSSSSSGGTLATSIRSNITLNGFSASESGSVITITGPTSAAGYSPVITQSPTVASGGIAFTVDVFPDITSASQTNFANWYSYYRTRMLMMKTATGRAFSSLTNAYRVGLMKISTSSSPSPLLGTFESTQRTNWYSTLYGTTTSGSTPLRTALSDAGRYYAGTLGVTDPVQYSCQQNFSILSTDGYWNSGNGYKKDGSTAVGNQDGSAARPMNDGAQAGTTVTTTYTRNTYTKISTGCSGSQRRLKTQPQIGTCRITTVGGVAGAESCTWVNNGSATNGACASSGSIVVPSPNPSTRVVSGTAVTTLGSIGGTSDNLADVAMYYYQTDLRPGTCTLCTDNVFISSTDNNVQQHMTTFTLGLGASGWMNYSSSYLSDSTGDYVAVKLGSTASSSVCTWQSVGSVCTWPVPGMDGSSNGFIANIDDLWHAAVNGRGAYFSATNPASLASGLSNALAGINARKGSAAAAATSTLNPVAGNNFAYVASYTTVEWRGNLEARGINIDTGVVSENATWCIENVVATGCPTTPVSQTDGSTTIYNCETPDTVTCPGGVIGFSGDLTSGTTYCKVPVAMSCTGTMNAKVSDATDTRTIKTANSAGTALIDFDSAYATANPSYFNAAHIGTLSQWSLLDATQKTNAAGVNLLKYLRGQYGYEDRSTNSGSDRLYRYRFAVLGDALESQPAFISKPLFSYPYPGYSAYVTAQASRAGTVYMGANDGMMHAFAADTGIERWAYVPSMIIPNMWKLADKNYATLHLNFVNGSPITSDVCVSSCSDAATAVWKTILVAGLNGGGRGYYALDITNPATPVLLWEFTPTTGIGKIQDDDVGYSYGQPIITKKADGTWVVLVTSGYNNTSPGSGNGYLYVLNAGTGAIISKIAAAAGGVVGDGLAKVSGRNDEPAGNSVGSIYGGDLAGNVWRFNINGTTTATIGTGDVMNFAILKDSTGATQPITTAPVLGKISGQNIVFVGTGKYLETGDLTTTQRQSQYAIKDDNAVTTFVNPRTTLVQQTLSNNADGTATRTGSNNVVNFYTGRGWYFDFPDTGERVNIDSKLVQGTLLIPSLVPSSTECSPGGYGWLNFVDYKTGGAIETLVSQKYDATIVGVNVIYVQGEPKVGVVTSSNPTPVLDENVSFPASAAGFTGKRTLWRELTR